MPRPVTAARPDLLQICADAVPPQPWRNGGGSTRVLCSGPSADDWLWRVSLADITQDGPFSAFPGVQRWFSVVHGAGVRLGLAAGPVALTTDSPPVAFDGAEAPACALLGGPTRDLNLMLRAPGARASLLAAQAGEAWLGLGRPRRGAGAAGWRAVFSSQPGLLHCGDAPPVALPAMSLTLQTETDADAGTTAWRWLPDPACAAHAATGVGTARDAAAPPPTGRAWWLAVQLAVRLAGA